MAMPNLLEEFDKPDCPQAASYIACFCKNPNCGLHIISFDSMGKAIIETVLPISKTLELVNECKDFLYSKAVLKDGK